MLGVDVKGVGRGMVVGATAACVAAVGLTGAAVAGATPAPSLSLVGAWSGPAIGTAGDCGGSSAEYSFSPNGTYRYKALYDNCDGIFVDGRYEIRDNGSTLQTTMDQCSAPGCPADASVITMSISAVDRDSIVLNGQYAYRRIFG